MNTNIWRKSFFFFNLGGPLDVDAAILPQQAVLTAQLDIVTISGFHGPPDIPNFWKDYNAIHHYSLLPYL